MKNFLIGCLFLFLVGCSGSRVVNYVPVIENEGSRAAIYWFWPPDVLANRQIVEYCNTPNGHRFEINPEYAATHKQIAQIETTAAMFENFFESQSPNIKLLVVSGSEVLRAGTSVDAPNIADYRIDDNVRNALSARYRDSFAIEDVAADDCLNSDGSVVLTDIESMRTGQPAPFSVTVDGSVYSGNFCGMLAFHPSRSGNIDKLASYGLLDLRRDGKVLLAFSQVTRVMVEKQGRDILFTIEDEKSQIKPLEDNL